MVIRNLIGKRSRGRPRQRCLDGDKRDIRTVNESASLEDTRDRDGRRSLVEAAKERLKLVKQKQKNDFLLQCKKFGIN